MYICYNLIKKVEVCVKKKSNHINEQLQLLNKMIPSAISATFLMVTIHTYLAIGYVENKTLIIWTLLNIILLLFRVSLYKKRHGQCTCFQTALHRPAGWRRHRTKARYQTP